MRAQLVGLDQPLMHQLAELTGFLGIEAGMRDDEAVAAQPRRIGGAGGAQPAHHLLQQHVAIGMAERIVDRLEARQIDGDDGEALGPAALGLEALIDGIAEAGARHRPGERVVRCEKRQPLLGAAAFGDVPEIEAGDAAAGGLARCRDILDNEPVVLVAAVPQHRERQRHRRRRRALGQHLPDGLAHFAGQNGVGLEPEQRLARRQQIRGDLAGREDATVRANHQHAGEIVRHHLRNGVRAHRAADGPETR